MSVLRTGRYGDGEVVVITQTVRASNPSRFNDDLFDVRQYNALFERTIIDAVRAQATTV